MFHVKHRHLGVGCLTCTPSLDLPPPRRRRPDAPSAPRHDLNWRLTGHHIECQWMTRQKLPSPAHGRGPGVRGAPCGAPRATRAAPRFLDAQRHNPPQHHRCNPCSPLWSSHRTSAACRAAPANAKSLRKLPSLASVVRPKQRAAGSANENGACPPSAWHLCCSEHHLPASSRPPR